MEESNTHLRNWYHLITWVSAAILTTLKMEGVVDWSWWWVTSPLWGPFAILFAGLMGAAFLIIAAFTVTSVIKSILECVNCALCALNDRLERWAKKK